MAKFKKLIVVGAAVLALGATTITAFAASDFRNPAEIIASLTGKSIDEITDIRYTTGKTYGTIANEAGELDNFKDQMLENKKVVLDQRVKDGYLTQQEADDIYNAMKENQAYCIGNGEGSREFRGMMGYGKGQRFGRCGGSRNGSGFNAQNY